MEAVLSRELLGCLARLKTKCLNGSYFGANNIDKVLEKYMPYNNGYYVELGANDGFRQSNSYYFELKKNWSGILIEPVPELYKSCVKLRGKKNKVFCNACVSFSYIGEFVQMTFADLMSVSDGLDLALADTYGHLINAKKHFRSSEIEYSFGAKARTLSSILEECSAPKNIEFLSLDVEGAELHVLDGIDFNKWRFKIILVETREFERVKSFLYTKGYSFFERVTFHDFLFSYDGLKN